MSGHVELKGCHVHGADGQLGRTELRAVMPMVCCQVVCRMCYVLCCKVCCVRSNAKPKE